MAILSLLAVVLIEQIWPLPFRDFVRAPLARLAVFLEYRLDAGGRRHAMLAWWLAAGACILFAGGTYFVLYRWSPLLAWLWNVLVLYLSLGFGQPAQYFLDIQQALRMEDADRARSLLEDWSGHPCPLAPAPEIARLSIRQALITSHRYFFAVVFWFALLPGPTGALLYRIAESLAATWNRSDRNPASAFGQYARSAFDYLDWLPARFTATLYAIAGNFEEAMYNWRARSVDKEPGFSCDRIIFASGSGALGVCLESRLSEQGEPPEGEVATPDLMQRTVSLLWRAAILCLLICLLFGFARLIGT